jgi:hypothetical protein
MAEHQSTHPYMGRCSVRDLTVARLGRVSESGRREIERTKRERGRNNIRQEGKADATVRWLGLASGVWLGLASRALRSKGTPKGEKGASPIGNFDCKCLVARLCA